MVDEGGKNDPLVASLKSYAKLCSKPGNRSTILKDQSFIQILTTLLGSSEPAIMTMLVKCALYLTENSEDATSLGRIPGIEDAIGSASERPFSPTILHNLIIVASRLRTAKSQRKENNSNISSETAPVRPASKFVGRKSKQLVYEFEQLTPDDQSVVEQRVLKKKGVISLYFNSSDSRVVIRTLQTVASEDILDILFDCGFDMVTQILRIDGKEESFCFYASEQRTKAPVQLPDYLDDIAVADPNSCMVTNEHAKAGGWFNSIASFVTGSLW